MAEAVPPVAQAYWQRLQSRPALQRAEARNGTLRLREDA
jgi:hypothetical protein